MDDLSRQIIKMALLEDLGSNGDISSSLIPNNTAKAIIISRQAGILSGSGIIGSLIDEYQNFSKNYSISKNFQDGDKFDSNDILFEIVAPIRTLLSCERSILNFLQRLCGIASKAHQLSQLIKDYPCKLLDTRKTSPGLRLLEKQAFRDGGGTNHRLDLSEMIMFKENHLAYISNLQETTNKAKLNFPNTRIEIEINKANLHKLKEILENNIDIIMLDNFGAEEAASLIQKIRSLNPKTQIEISGGINEANLLDYAKALPDYISSSLAMTQANNIDLSMLIDHH
jgi:nicotinate-nucleotide pyrophosphorylase (carboxylating)